MSLKAIITLLVMIFPLISSAQDKPDLRGPLRDPKFSKARGPIRNHREADLTILKSRLCVESYNENRRLVTCHFVADLMVQDPSLYKEIFDLSTIAGYTGIGSTLIGCGSGRPSSPVWIAPASGPFLQRTNNQLSFDGPSLSQRENWQRKCDRGSGSGVQSVGDHTPGGDVFQKDHQTQREGEGFLDALVAGCHESPNGRISQAAQVFKKILEEGAKIAGAEALKELAKETTKKAFESMTNEPRKPESVPVDPQTDADPANGDDYADGGHCDPNSQSCEVKIKNPDGESTRNQKVDVDNEHNASNPTTVVDTSGGSKITTTTAGDVVTTVVTDANGKAQSFTYINTKTQQVTHCQDNKCTEVQGGQNSPAGSSGGGSTPGGGKPQQPPESGLTKCAQIAARATFIKEYCALSKWRDGYCRALHRAMQGCTDERVINPNPDGLDLCPVKNEATLEAMWEAACKKRSMIMVPSGEGYSCKRPTNLDLSSLLPNMCNHPEAYVTSDMCPQQLNGEGVRGPVRSGNTQPRDPRKDRMQGVEQGKPGSDWTAPQ